MVKEHTHICQGTCSREIHIKYDDQTNKIVDVDIIGGCQGNLRGIKALIINEDIDCVHDKLKGIRCGAKFTSCPDQIALAIEELKSL